MVYSVKCILWEAEEEELKVQAQPWKLSNLQRFYLKIKIKIKKKKMLKHCHLPKAWVPTLEKKKWEERILKIISIKIKA